MSNVLTRYQRESLRLHDFSDRELVGILDDVSDAEGWASRRRIAQTIFPFVGEDDDSDRIRHALRCVAIRLAWLRRFGVVDRRATKAGMESEWTVTDAGHHFLRGKLTGKEERLIAGLPEEKLVAATRVLTGNYQRSSSIAANLIRREWIYGANGTRRT